MSDDQIKPDIKEKIPVPARVRLGVILLNGSILAVGGWLVTVGNRSFSGVTWQEWVGLLVLVLGAACRDFLNYTSITWDTVIQNLKKEEPADVLPDR